MVKLVNWHIKNADISACGTYRYRLGRIHGKGPWCTFIMLNPSTADGSIDDPTIRKCMAFAAQWGCGQMNVVNLFAYRATDPKQLVDVDNPVGPENDEHLAKAFGQLQDSFEREEQGYLVCAWGKRGTLYNRDIAVMKLIANYPLLKPAMLRVNKDGTPEHPLYIPYSIELQTVFPRPYEGRKSNRVEGGES